MTVGLDLIGFFEYTPFARLRAEQVTGFVEQCGVGVAESCLRERLSTRPVQRRNFFFSEEVASGRTQECFRAEQVVQQFLRRE